eukprot:4141097-Pleurochrysis_carterae.AAC.1
MERRLCASQSHMHKMRQILYVQQATNSRLAGDAEVLEIVDEVATAAHDSVAWVRFSKGGLEVDPAVNDGSALRADERRRGC